MEHGGTPAEENNANQPEKQKHANVGKFVYFCGKIYWALKELTFSDIQEIIRNDEGRTLEVKETTGEIVKAMCAACAFLNSDGGWLVFGVTPKLKIVGQQVTDNTKQEIANHLRKIEPSINVSVQYLDVPGKTDYQVIALYFDPTTFSNAPYTYDGRAYYKLATNGGLNGGLKLTERETQVVERLREVPGQTVEEVALALDIPKRTLERTFALLKRKGFIEKEGSRKNGIWKVIL